MSLTHLTQPRLDEIITVFKHLNDHDRNTVIDSIVSASGPNQLLHLSKLLPDFLFRDFICFLPLEIVQKVLQYLDGKQLLACCQVSRTWNERINSLPGLWRELAQTAGADLRVVECSGKHNVRTELKDEFLSESALYKKLYLQSLALLKGLEHGQSLKINENFIVKDPWRITSLAYQFGNLVTGCDDHTVQIWSVPDANVLKAISTHSVSCLRVTETHLFTASFNADAQCWDLETGLHCQSLCGHTSAVITIDVMMNGSYVLTGSVDKTAKLWRLCDTTSELVRTFTVHEDWVFHVKFLPCCQGNLQLFTCDSLFTVVWLVDPGGNILASYHIGPVQEFRFTSFYHFHSDPFIIFTCQWTEDKKTSALAKYIIRPESRVIERDFLFTITDRSQDTMKAFLLGAGEKFAVIMCSISRKDFHIIDIPQRIVVATILTPDFCMLTRNGSTMTLCDTSWLDGFNFSQLAYNRPVFAACVGRNSVILGTWNVQKGQNKEINGNNEIYNIKEISLTG